MGIFKKIKQFCGALSEVWRLRPRRCAFCCSPFKPTLVFSRHEPLAVDPPERNIPSLCPECQGKTPQRTAGYCPLCGSIYPRDSVPCIPCPLCLKDPPPWDRLLFYGIYEGMLREIIHEAKFEGSIPALGLAGELLCLAARPVWHEHIDAIVPVPLHVSRLRERGANQCVEMSRPLSKFLGVKIRSDLLLRVRKTPHQLGLDAKARMRNLDNAFIASPACKGLHILLVDDVMTTGTTMRRCAEALHDVGVASVTILALGRARGH